VTWYKITPIDTLFFKNAKPFNAGQDMWSKSMFPPLPSVYRGAFRTAYFAENIDEFHRAGEKDDPTLNIKIGLTAIAKKRKEYFPVPLDLYILKDKHGSRSEVKVYEKKKLSCVSSYPFEYVLSENENINYDESETDNVGPDDFIDLASLNCYLAKAGDSLELENIDSFITYENKTGIAIDRCTGNSKQSMLYQIYSIRMKNNVSMLVDVENMNDCSCKTIKLGGEARAASVEKCNKDVAEAINTPTITGKEFKIYLASPAIFSNGWLPGWINPKDMTGTYEVGNRSVTVRVTVAATGRPIAAGGFDMKAKKPKEMVAAVPAGSVYYMELIKGSIEDVVELFHKKKISDSRSEDGFGYCMIGVV